MIYLLDANVLIQAHRFSYPMDIFPKFRVWLEEENENQNICSVTAIYEEMKAGKDELANWAKSQNLDSWFLPVEDHDTQTKFGEIANWLMSNQQFKDHAKQSFLDCADSWLIAKAMTGNYTVVTQEKSDPKSKKKVFIPDVCNQFQVPHMDTLYLIRELGGKF